MISVSKQQMKWNQRNHVRNRSEMSKPTISQNEIVGGPSETVPPKQPDRKQQNEEAELKAVWEFWLRSFSPTSDNFFLICSANDKQINLKHIFRLFSPDVTDFPALKSWVVSASTFT